MKKRNTIYLSREFGEQSRADTIAAYDALHAVASTSQSTPLELRAVLDATASNPLAPVILRLPMRRSFPNDNEQIGDAAISLVRGARMVFDPRHEDFVHEIKEMVNAGLAKPVLGQSDHTGFQGPGWKMLKEAVHEGHQHRLGPRPGSPMRSF